VAVGRDSIGRFLADRTKLNARMPLQNAPGWQSRCRSSFGTEDDELSSAIADRVEVIILASYLAIVLSIDRSKSLCIL
jgi:hypothetical protein